MLFGKVGAGKVGGGRTIGQQGSGSAGGGPEVPGPSGVAGAELGPGGGRRVSSLCVSKNFKHTQSLENLHKNSLVTIKGS